MDRRRIARQLLRLARQLEGGRGDKSALEQFLKSLPGEVKFDILDAVYHDSNHGDLLDAVDRTYKFLKKLGYKSSGGRTMGPITFINDDGMTIRITIDTNNDKFTVSFRQMRHTNG